jgi:tetratricopeptide (TPR) repeat protein
MEPSPANYYSLAALHKDNKQYDACRQVTSLILESNPGHVPSYLLRGICAYEQKQYGKALVDLLQSHSLAPAQAEQFIYIGKILMKQGKTDEATAWLLRGASLYLVQGKTVEQQEALKLAGGKGQ